MANKKTEVAKKMGLVMNGKGSSYGGGMKYQGQSKGGIKKGGMNYKTTGEDQGYAKGQKPDMVNKKHSFSNNYEQNGGK